MKILFYRYNNICEPAIIKCFRDMNIEVIEETVEMAQKNLTTVQRVELVQQAIKTHKPLFIFSINFFPAIAEICHIYKTMYLCWTVDCPVPELFSTSILHNTNRIFLFDKAQYELFHPYNPDCIFYMPLAADVPHFDQVLNTITPEQVNAFSHDISFVGSLYTEKNPLRTLEPLPEYLMGYIDGVTESSLKVYGYNFIEETITTDIIQALKERDSHFYTLDNAIVDCSAHVAAHSYIGLHVAEAERIRTLNKLADTLDVDLYTRSDTSSLTNVNIHGGIQTLSEMPRVFHLSKINLNITIKPIQTGLPLRIFDIMGCGGFVMTNYQAELSDYFEIGVDLEAYSSLEELVDKCTYYLSHDSERKQIALNGYEKVKSYHTYQHRILEMFKVVMNTLEQ